MQTKLSKLKETFDKLKNYTYNFNVMQTEQGAISEFTCKLFVNSLLISSGQGKNTKIAKQKCSDQGFDELMKKDWEFAEKNNFIVPKDDHYKFLQILIKKIKQELFIQQDKEIQPQLEETKDGYKQCYLEFIQLRGEGYSLIEKNAINISAYNLILSIVEKYSHLQHIEIINYYYVNYLNKKLVQSQQDASKKVKMEYNDRIYEQNQIRNVQNNVTSNVQSNIFTQIVMSNPKIEIQDAARGESQQFTQNNNQINENNSTLCFSLAKQLQLNNESSFIFLKFIQQIAGFNFQITGSFISKSIRITKPELDIILEIPDQHENKFQLFLKDSEIDFRIQKEDNLIILTQIGQPIQTRLKIQVPSLKIKLYCYKGLIDEQYFIHCNEMIKYSQKYDQLYFSSLSLCLVHQWRDDNMDVLPKQLLDYLLVQSTNQFSYLNSPYQVLCQIIYLLKMGILDELSQRNLNENELNPFLQSIIPYYQELVHKLNNEILRQIKQQAGLWNKIQISIWVKKYI